MKRSYYQVCGCNIFVGVVLLLSFLQRLHCQHLICENRNPEGHTPRKTEGDGGFRIVVVGNYSTRGGYAPNDVYTVTIQGLKTRYSTQKFTEFLLVTESEKQLTMGQTGVMTTGLFHIIDDSHSRYSDQCPDGVTNVNMQPKTEISVLWTAPSVLVASCITFKVTVVERPHVWYMDDGQLTKTLCPEMPRRMRVRLNRQPVALPPPSDVRPEPALPVISLPTQMTNKNDANNASQIAAMIKKQMMMKQGASGQTDPTLAPSSQALDVPVIALPSTSLSKPKCCACDEAKYEVRFEGVWSKETHPRDFPENEWLLHFSDIIGASHSPDYYVWQAGEVASEGIRQVAEWGATRHLETELKSKSRFINTIIKAKGLWHPDERGTTSASFRVDKHHHLMSLVSMIGPSPDWIVGITSHDLCLQNCTWLEEADFDLYPYDAGTDSGVTYMSPNTPTEPRQKIRPLTNTDPNDPRSPFHDPSNSNPMKPFAKVHIRRQRIYPKNCNDTSTPTDNTHEVYLTENSEDINRPECVVSDWTPWSDCSVTCGKGLRMRKRSYMIPAKADMFRCDRQLVEKEMCLGNEPACASDNTSVFEEIDSICAVTVWSDWTPCSETCGKGTRSRSRRYKTPMGRKKCNLEMTQTEMCVISMDCVNNANASIADEQCPMTPWSYWTPCSVTCGVGIRERTRVPLLIEPEEIAQKCGSRTTSQRAPCTGEFGINCQINRDEARQICALPADPGFCTEAHTKFAYNVEKFMCVPFEWSGCKGNRNRFETEAECNTVCGVMHSIWNQQPSTTTTITATTPKIGALSIDHRNPVSNLTNHSTVVVNQTETVPPNEPPTSQVDLLDGETDDEQTNDDLKPNEKSTNSSQSNSSDITSPIIDCVVSRWSSWAPCSVTCGTGTKLRTREVLIKPQNGGKKCPRLQKKKTCRVDPCLNA